MDPTIIGVPPTLLEDLTAAVASPPWVPHPYLEEDLIPIVYDIRRYLHEYRQRRKQLLRRWAKRHIPIRGKHFEHMGSIVQGD